MAEPFQFDQSSGYPDPISMAYSHWKFLVAERRSERPDASEVIEAADYGTLTDPDTAVESLGDAWTVRSRWTSESGNKVVVATASGRVLLAHLMVGMRMMTVMTAATVGDGDTASEVVAKFGAACEPLTAASDDVLAIRFWSYDPMGGGRAYLREIEAPEWADCASNYSSATDDDDLDVREHLAELMAMTGPPEQGRMMIMSGPAGTGKTSAIRMLGQAWKEWANVEYVIDSNEFFAHADYMTQVMLGEYGDDRWRILVLEDVDELISADAKSRSGQGTSRLLNMADGLLGQGLRVLIIATTNEPIDSLHAAIIRPGRCFANLYIGALNADDADAWRVEHGLPETGEGDATLAELWAEARGQEDLALTAAGIRRDQTPIVVQGERDWFMPQPTAPGIFPPFAPVQPYPWSSPNITYGTGASGHTSPEAGTIALHADTVIVNTVAEVPDPKTAGRVIREAIERA